MPVLDDLERRVVRVVRPHGVRLTVRRCARRWRCGRRGHVADPVFAIAWALSQLGLVPAREGRGGAAVVGRRMAAG